jgi:hypothetical protein
MANKKRPRPVTINVQTGEVEPMPYKARDRTKLDTPADILKELQRLYRRMKCEHAEPTQLAWMLGEIRKTMELTEITEQVERLKLLYARHGAPDLTASPLLIGSDNRQDG